MIEVMFAAALSLAPQQAVSGSSDARTEADFRCYAAAIVLAGVSGDDQATTDAASLVAFYYLGRLEGRAPNVDWIDRGITVGNAQAEMLLAELPRCGSEFEAKAQSMVEKGQAAS